MRSPRNSHLGASSNGIARAVGTYLVRERTAPTNLDVARLDFSNLDTRFCQQLSSRFLANKESQARHKPPHIIGAELEHAQSISFQLSGDPSIVKVSDVLEISVG